MPPEIGSSRSVGSSDASNSASALRYAVASAQRPRHPRRRADAQVGADDVDRVADRRRRRRRLAPVAQRVARRPRRQRVLVVLRAARRGDRRDDDRREGRRVGDAEEAVNRAGGAAAPDGPPGGWMWCRPAGSTNAVRPSVGGGTSATIARRASAACPARRAWLPSRTQRESGVASSGASADDDAPRHAPRQQQSRRAARRSCIFCACSRRSGFDRRSGSSRSASTHAALHSSRSQLSLAAHAPHDVDTKRTDAGIFALDVVAANIRTTTPYPCFHMAAAPASSSGSPDRAASRRKRSARCCARGALSKSTKMRSARRSRTPPPRVLRSPASPPASSSTNPSSRKSSRCPTARRKAIAVGSSDDR